MFFVQSNVNTVPVNTICSRVSMSTSSQLTDLYCEHHWDEMTTLPVVIKLVTKTIYGIVISGVSYMWTNDFTTK